MIKKEKKIHYLANLNILSMNIFSVLIEAEMSSLCIFSSNSYRKKWKYYN